MASHFECLKWGFELLVIAVVISLLLHSIAKEITRRSLMHGRLALRNAPSYISC